MGLPHTFESPTVERGRLGAEIRRKGADSPEAEAARRNLAAAKIAAHIERALTAAPPLTEEQADRLASMLRGGSTSAAAR